MRLIFDIISIGLVKYTMFKILKKKFLNKSVSYMKLYAPLVAKNAQAGQFLILRIDEFGERIPLTIFDYDRENGTVEIIYQKVGTTTLKLDRKQEGEYLLDVVGPLGNKSEIKGFKKAIVVSGGVGSAIAYPLAKELKSNGTKTMAILGFRNKDLIILENEMKKIADEIEIVTDDGSNGKKGFVTDALIKELEKCCDYDLVISIGPIPMMKAVCEITKKYSIKTIVSMNSIMIDGTGMCGGCRLTVGGKVKFACVDGPDFDGHEVDFQEATIRNNSFVNQEKKSYEKYCNLFKGV